MDHDGVPSECDDAIHVFLGELEIQCIAIPETKVGWKFRREDEFVGFVEALSFLSVGICARAEVKNLASSHTHSDRQLFLDFCVLWSRS